MPNKLIYQEEVDIYELPTVIEKSQEGEITIGGLHGNAIKLLFILIKHGIITHVKLETYRTLVDIYYTSFDLESFLSYSYWRCLNTQPELRDQESP